VETDFCACVVVFWTGYDIAYRTCRGFCLVIVCPEGEPVVKAIAWVGNHPDRESVDPSATWSLDALHSDYPWAPVPSRP
jgi:hypothetical protein